jgi:hypothetical protein
VVKAKSERRKLIDVCVERAGVRWGARVAFRVVQWSIVGDSIGHFPSISEYSQWSGVDLRTAERHRAAIRGVFSEDEFREVVGQLMKAHVARMPGVKARSVRVAV